MQSRRVSVHSVQRAACACALLFAAVAWSAPAGAAESLAAHVPASTNLFVEVHGLGRLLAMRPMDGVDALLGVPVQATADGAATGPWLGRIKSVAEIDRAELLRSYFGAQVAVAAPSWGALAEGVLLARVNDAAKIDELFARARGPVLTLPGEARVCALRDETDGLWLASRGDVIVLGPNPAPADGKRAAASYFLRVAELLTAGGESLSLGDSRADAPAGAGQAGVAGRLFLRRGNDGTERAPVSAADHMIDGLLRQAESIHATFELAGDTVRVHATGQSASTRAHLRSPGSAAFRVPNDALAVWRFGYDYQAAFDAKVTSSLSAQVRFLLTLAEGATPDVSLANDFIPTLGLESVLVVGREPAAGATPFDLPTVTFATRATDAAMAATVSRQLLGRIAEVCNFQLRRAGEGRQVAVRRETHNGVEMESLSVGPFLATVSDCEFFSALQLSWCVLDGWLVVSSNPSDVRRIIDANRADADASPDVTAVASAPTSAGETVAVRPLATAEMLRNWVRYLRTEHPHVLEDGWWELVKQRRSGARVELGIGTKADPDQPGKVRVALTLEGWPASGLVHKDDFIIGVDGQLLSTDDPVEDFKRLVRRRKHLDYAVLRVERDGRLRDVRVGIPVGAAATESDRNPAQLLEPLAAMLERFESATYELTFQDDARFVADISLQLPPRGPAQARATTARVVPAQ